MSKAVKALKITGIVIISLPFALAALYIVWEIICALVNNISGVLHTQDVINGYGNCASIEVLDNVTFVGNTSGTGNHTEVRSTVLVRANDINELEYRTNGDSYYITPLFEKVPEEKYDRWSRELDLPYESDCCYVVEVYGKVPFRDSIMGH
ncbi:MAG: hypothetical protein ACI4KM_03205 [Oscillospiraceae bacterium]